MPLLLFALILIPVIACILAKRRWPGHVWSITGFSFGLVASPVSLGLYCAFYLSPYISIWPGMAGLMLSLFHGKPGFELATVLGLREAKTLVSGYEHLIIEILNGIIWGLVYGVIGYGIDNYLRVRKRRIVRS